MSRNEPEKTRRSVLVELSSIRAEQDARHRAQCEYRFSLHVLSWSSSSPLRPSLSHRRLFICWNADIRSCVCVKNVQTMWQSLRRKNASCKNLPLTLCVLQLTDLQVIQSTVGHMFSAERPLLVPDHHTQMPPQLETTLSRAVPHTHTRLVLNLKLCVLPPLKSGFSVSRHWPLLQCVSFLSTDNSFERKSTDTSFALAPMTDNYTGNRL